ncbi:uncharacterized protein N7518_000220 [Penicillium psychrosexuale]|uniref:uncharacterized protein n=1 Tax=Penicillium psychrosexuale TaxID=1002107 RepID=UPI002544E0DB|nr:uncharacterized protein N7518_000220 [Penicillium psychrosexuale]KAJ5803917.1 hypothetical protein N7518_000220 [Penicillium psychrosexuale]
MSNHLFCCSAIQPKKLPNPEHEQTFTEFTKWALSTPETSIGSIDPSESSVCMQLIQRAKRGPVESIQYFVPSDTDGNFEEVSIYDIADANFEKIHERKILRCHEHRRVYDLNIYEPSTGSSRRWRESVAKPLKQLENAVKQRMPGSASGSGTRPGSASRPKPVLGSGFEQKASSGHGYDSEWGFELGYGCGHSWGSEGSDKHVPSSIIVETGSMDSDCDCDGEDQDQDPEVAPDDGTEDTNQNSDKDQPVSSSLRLETQNTSHDEDSGSQSYLHIEDHGCYYSGLSSYDYGNYDCDGGYDYLLFD